MVDEDEGRLDELERELGRLARTITDDDRHLVDPPPGLFESITDELSATRDFDASAAARTYAPSASAEPGSDVGGTVVPFRRSRRGQRIALAAAAAVVVVVGAVGVLATRDGDDGGEIVASVAVRNDELPFAHDGAGQATLVDDDGQLYLELTVDGLPAVDGFYEVWLIDTDVDGMVSLGTTEGDGRWRVPAGVEPTRFPVVDVSVEPADGDPTHSGQSILRGVLEL